MLRPTFRYNAYAVLFYKLNLCVSIPNDTVHGRTTETLRTIKIRIKLVLALFGMILWIDQGGTINSLL